MSTANLSLQLVNILLDICSQGCIISSVKSPGCMTYKKPEMSVIKFFFPNLMVPNKTTLYINYRSRVI